MAHHNAERKGIEIGSVIKGAKEFLNIYFRKDISDLAIQNIQVYKCIQMLGAVHL